MPPTHLFVLSWELHHPGGVNEVVVNLFRKFEEKGPLAPAVLVSDWDAVRPRVGEVDGRRTIQARLHAPHEEGRPLWSFVLFLLTLPRALWRLSRVLRREGVEVVNPHYPALTTWNFVLVRRLGLWRGRVVVSAHGDEILAATRTRGWQRWLWRRMLRGADRIVTPSHHLEQEVLRLEPRLAPKIRVVYNGVDAGRLEDLGRDATLPEELRGARYVLHVGSYERRKAQDVLLRAFARVAPGHPGVALVCVGGRGPWSGRMEAMIAEAGLEGRVHRYEAVPFPTVVALMKHALVLALPSRHESFGIVFVEAGVFGVPSVGTRVGGVPEVIADGENGLLVDAEDAGAFAERLARLLDDAAERRRLGAAMHRAVEERFNWDRARDEYADVLGESA